MYPVLWPEAGMRGVNRMSIVVAGGGDAVQEGSILFRNEEVMQVLAINRKLSRSRRYLEIAEELG